MATNWDKNIPGGSQVVSASVTGMLANNAVLEDALGRDHNFPGNENVDAGEHVVMTLQKRSSNPAFAVDKGKLYTIDSGGSLILRYLNSASGAVLVDFFQPGVIMWFYQDIAPAGWTIVSAPDALLAVKGGSRAYNVNGGNIAGTWTIAGITVNNHTLTVSELPSHVHPINYGQGEWGGWGTASNNILGTRNSGSTGGGQAHNHDLTIGSAWRPKAGVGIICSKN